MILPAFVPASGLSFPGDYSAALDVDVDTLITRERTMSEHAVIAIVLRLQVDGAAEATVWSDFERRQSASRFAPGGASKSHEQRREQAIFKGTWSTEGAAGTIDLTSTSAPAAALVLRCHDGTTEAGPALGCELLAAPDWLFAPGRSEETGSRGWLLLGKTPGLWVATRQGFHDREPSVSMKRAEHPASEADLAGSWVASLPFPVPRR